MPEQTAEMCPCQHTRLGYTITDGVLHKTVEREKHHLRTPPGWAIQEAIINQHKDELTEIVLHELDTSKRYEVSMKHFLKYAKPLDRGFGAQLMLHDDFWITRYPGRPGPGIQMSLF